MRLHVQLAVYLGLSQLACAELPELSYETEHLRIGTEYEAPLCAGNLAHYERVITTLEATLETSVGEPVEVYIWDPLREESPGWCSNDYALGCYREGKVYADLISVEHELVHAVLATFAKPAPFWDEGAAEALQATRTLFGGSAPSANLDLDTPALSYLSAGHFSRWLFETYGAATYRDLLAAGGDARGAFEGVYAMDFEQAEEQFFAEAPYSYGALISCEHAPLAETGELAWSEALDVDCGSEDVRSTPFGMQAYRLLTITQSGHYELTTSAELGYISRCDDETLLDPPVPGDPTVGDVPPTTETAIFQFGLSFPGEGAVTTLDLAPGRYEIAAGFRSFEAQEATLEVAAARGPVPQTPEGP